MAGKHNVAVELAKKILRDKLTQLENLPTVGDEHGQNIEYIARIEDNPDGYMQFFVRLWDETGDEPVTTKTLSFYQLQDLVSRYAQLPFESDAYDFVKKLPKLNFNAARIDSIPDNYWGR